MKIKHWLFFVFLLTGVCTFAQTPSQPAKNEPVSNSLSQPQAHEPDDRVSSLPDVAQDDYGSLTLYPNPTTGNLNCIFQLAEPGKVAIFLADEQGKRTANLVSSDFENGRHSTQSDISDFGAGNYVGCFPKCPCCFLINF
jgi:hypothetical protein